MTPPRWQLASNTSLLTRSWDDTTVVFFVGPGDTHLVNELGLYVLQALQAGPADVDGLVARVRSRAPEASDEEARDAVQSLVPQFQKAGLVDRIDA